MTLLGREVLPDPDTVGDWLRRLGDPAHGQAGLVGLGQVRDALTARLLRRDGIPAYTMDVDATLVEAEKREAQWSAQGVQGALPLLGFLFETPGCLLDEFREGNISPVAGHLAFYQQVTTRLPEGKRIAAYRADSASYQAELINALEADGVMWAITADQDAAVKGLTRARGGGVAGTCGGLRVSARRNRPYDDQDHAGVSADHQARAPAPGRPV